MCDVVFLQERKSVEEVFSEKQDVVFGVLSLVHFVVLDVRVKVSNEDFDKDRDSVEIGTEVLFIAAVVTNDSNDVRVVKGNAVLEEFGFSFICFLVIVNEFLENHLGSIRSLKTNKLDFAVIGIADFSDDFVFGVVLSNFGDFSG